MAAIAISSFILFCDDRVALKSWLMWAEYIILLTLFSKSVFGEFF